MTNTQKMQAFEMRINGYTWDEIGEKLGYAGSSVRDGLTSCIRGATRKPACCIYPNLQKYIAENYSGSIPEFSEACGIGYAALYKFLTGRTSSRRIAVALQSFTGIAPDDF